MSTTRTPPPRTCDQLGVCQQRTPACTGCKTRPTFREYPYVEQSIKDRQLRALSRVLWSVINKTLLFACVTAAVMSAYSCVGG
jgi:hypothetical protein